MALLVDTCVWSLAYRRDTPPGQPEVSALRHALTTHGDVVTTGVIYLEVLRGFVPPRAREIIRREFSNLEFLEPMRSDYEASADLATRCRSAGVQLGSIDALIAQLAIAGGHALLTTDQDFIHAAKHCDLYLWRGAQALG